MDHKKQSFILCIFAISIMKSKAEIKARIKIIQDRIKNQDYDFEGSEYAELTTELEALEWVLEI